MEFIFLQSKTVGQGINRRLNSWSVEQEKKKEKEKEKKKRKEKKKKEKNKVFGTWWGHICTTKRV